jgi:hypothetical protein
LTGIAVKVTLAPAHIDVWLADMETEGVMLEADIVMVLLLTDGVVTQTALLVIVTVTWSLLASEELVNVSAVCPGMVIPFTCHAYPGDVPPFTGVAVNVTLAPRQIDVWLAVIETEGVTLVAEIVIVLLVAIGESAHGALLVIVTLTWSLFSSEEVENETPVSPGTVIPFICHK